MKAQTFAGGPGYLFIAGGATLAFISALTPHFATGYHLNTGVLAAGLAPWLVYALAVPLVRSVVTDAGGLLLLLAHAVLVVNERFLQSPYGDDTIYVVPLLLALLVTPLLPLALRKADLYRHRKE